MKKSILIFLLIFWKIEFLNAQQSDYVAIFNNSFKWKLTKTEILSNPEIVVYKNGQTYPVYQIDFSSLKVNEVHYSALGNKLNSKMIERIKTLAKSDEFRIDVKIKVGEKLLDLNSIFILVTDKKIQDLKSDLRSIALIKGQTKQELTIDELLRFGKLEVKSNDKCKILYYKVIYYDRGERKQITNNGKLFSPELKKVIKNRKKYFTLLFTDIYIEKNGEKYLLNQVIIKIK